MTEESTNDTARAPRRAMWWWVAGIAIVVAGVIVYFAVTSSGAPDDGDASPSPTTSSSATEDAAQDGDPAAEPTPDPSATSETMPELAPVSPDDPADNGEGLTARIVKMAAVEGEAVQAGEIGGPAVQFTLELTNDTDAAVDLGFIAVNAYIGDDRTPAGGLVRPGGAPFEGTLEPGKTAQGVYVYTIPEAQRGDVTITVDYRAGQPAFVFRGAVG
ncbi:hypothetical protein RAC69_15980 [Microbacterium sp. LS_15]|uniref:hypothetical protein n=1 Tax=Microbacterium sp. LS_15 TaxID=3055790 RepID=UPI0035C08F55